MMVTVIGGGRQRVAFSDETDGHYHLQPALRDYDL